MIAPDLPPHLSVDDYLAGEREGLVRHEYVRGQVYAMAGASDRHNRIALNLASRLNGHLVGHPCQVFMSDMKVRVADDVYYYPDVVVACDPPGGDRYCRSHPRLVVEILSSSTERIDRHEKLLAYAQVAGLVEYVLVAQDKREVERLWRRPDGSWGRARLTRPDEVLALGSVELDVTLADIYRGVDDLG